MEKTYRSDNSKKLRGDTREEEYIDLGNNENDTDTNAILEEGNQAPPNPDPPLVEVNNCQEGNNRPAFEEHEVATTPTTEGRYPTRDCRPPDRYY